MEPVAVLFIGDHEWSDFADVHRWLERHAALRSVADVAAAADLLAPGQFAPRLIVLGQAWPGRFTATDAGRLMRMTPLARICELLGGWCEGETCSGEPITGSLRLYWHQWVARLAPEFARAAAGQRPFWELPNTATEEERLLELPPAAPIGGGALVAVITRHAELAEVLCEAAAKYGFGAVWMRRPRRPLVAGIRAAIWDAPANSAVAQEELRLWQPLLHRAQVAALTDFPRVEDRDHLLAAGATIVVSRPFWLHDLFAQLASVSRDAPAG